MQGPVLCFNSYPHLTCPAYLMSMQESTMLFLTKQYAIHQTNTLLYAVQYMGSHKRDLLSTLHDSTQYSTHVLVFEA